MGACHVKAGEIFVLRTILHTLSYQLFIFDQLVDTLVLLFLDSRVNSPDDQFLLAIFFFSLSQEKVVKFFKMPPPKKEEDAEHLVATFSKTGSAGLLLSYHLFLLQHTYAHMCSRACRHVSLGISGNTQYYPTLLSCPICSEKASVSNESVWAEVYSMATGPSQEPSLATQAILPFFVSVFSLLSSHPSPVPPTISASPGGD